MSAPTPTPSDASTPASLKDATDVSSVDVDASPTTTSKAANTGGFLNSITKHLTLTNLLSLYILYELLPFGGGGGSGGNQSISNEPMLKQHFSWEPQGYVAWVSGLPTKPPKKSKKPNSKTEDSDLYGGYYTRDKFAMQSVLLSIPRLKPDQRARLLNKSNSSISNLTQSDFDIELNGQAEELHGRTLVELAATKAHNETHKKNTTKIEGLMKKTGFLMSSAIVVLDLQLESDPTEEIVFIQSVVAFLVGITRETKGSLEVVMRLKSSGGSVTSYGLLAEHLRRLRDEPNITLTIACDLFALSGGYLVASVASPGQLLASPFASIGSIGVIHEAGLDLDGMMTNHGIKDITIKSGARKALGAGFGRVTDDDVRLLQERADATHQIFLDYVLRWRGDVIQDKDFVSTGDHWLGIDAMKHGLVDKLVTSEEYLDAKMQEGYNVLLMKEHSTNKDGQGESSSLWSTASWILSKALALMNMGDSKAVAADEYSEHTLRQVIRSVGEALRRF